eukprot:scaffold133803_cov105-Phaeocystis_antarctica.AAC.3
MVSCFAAAAGSDDAVVWKVFQHGLPSRHRLQQYPPRSHSMMLGMDMCFSHTARTWGRLSFGAGRRARSCQTVPGTWQAVSDRARHVADRDIIVRLAFGRGKRSLAVSRRPCQARGRLCHIVPGSATP